MSKNIDINKIQTLMNAVNNGIWSQCEVMDLLFSCTQIEAQYITKSYQMFVVELNDFNDHFDVVKDMSIGQGQYEIKDCLTIEDPASLGLKRMGELGAYAANTSQQNEQMDWPMTTDYNKVFSLQALDPKNLGFDDVNELAKLLEFVEQNKVYVPYKEAGFFKAAKGKVTKPFYTSQNCDGAIAMNGAFWVPSKLIMDIMALAKQTSAKVIVQCLRKIVDKCGPLTMDKTGRIRVNGKKSGKKEKQKFQEHKKSEAEIKYLKAVESGVEDEIVSTFWDFSSDFGIETGNAYNSVLFAAIYKEWCDKNDFKTDDTDDDSEFQDCSGDAEDGADKDDEGEDEDDDSNNKPSDKKPSDKIDAKEDEDDEEVKLDRRLSHSADIKKDHEISKSNVKFFNESVKVKDNSYKINNVQIPLSKDCNYLPIQFVKDTRHQRVNSVAKLLLVEDFDLKTNIFMELYKNSDKGFIRSVLLHNIQYLGFRMTNSNKAKNAAPVMDGFANVPAFVVYYEIMQSIKKNHFGC